MILSCLTAFVLMVAALVVSVAAGAHSEGDPMAPSRALTALLVAAAMLMLQAILWVRLGTLL